MGEHVGGYVSGAGVRGLTWLGNLVVADKGLYDDAELYDCMNGCIYL